MPEFSPLAGEIRGEGALGQVPGPVWHLPGRRRTFGPSPLDWSLSCVRVWCVLTLRQVCRVLSSCRGDRGRRDPRSCPWASVAPSREEAHLRPFSPRLVSVQCQSRVQSSLLLQGRSREKGPSLMSLGQCGTFPGGGAPSALLPSTGLCPVSVLCAFTLSHVKSLLLIHFRAREKGPSLMSLGQCATFPGGGAPSALLLPLP